MPEKEKKTRQYIERMKRKGVKHYTIPKYDCGIKYMVRYVDDITMYGTNKRELHLVLERIEKYCEEKLRLVIKDNKQVFLFAKEVTEKIFDKTGNLVKEVIKQYGRALDFMGFLFRRTRTTIRKAILYRITRKARKLSKKEKVNWYDATSMVSRMGYFKHTNCYKAYEKHVKPYVNIKTLKKKISKHGKKGRTAYAN